MHVEYIQLIEHVYYVIYFVEAFDNTSSIVFIPRLITAVISALNKLHKQYDNNALVFVDKSVIIINLNTTKHN